MAIGAEFGLLGPLLVRNGGATVEIPPGKQRVLAATLLLSANRTVSHDELAEALWGETPPPSMRPTLRNHVKRLRRALAGTGPARIATLPDGYLISVAPGELDVSRFETLQHQARAAARDDAWDQVAVLLREALALWRGEPLADVRSELLTRREVPRLAELRAQALQARIDADLRLGRHGEVIAELRQLTSAYPLTERLHALLMLALYRDGQQAQALAAYQNCRRVLVDELGAEPGPELRQLQRQILAADPALAVRAITAGKEAVAAPDRPGAKVPAPGVPRQLPAAVRHFTGRTAELAELTSVLEDAAAAGQARLIVVAGTAGVGKTALAVQWGQLVADRFGDGQLYVDLRGYDAGQPMDPGEALAGFLRALGVPGQQIPAETTERAGLYRSLLADRSVLAVLDNASSAEQVRLLLPGTSGSAAVVTSRDALPGLVAREGAARLDLDLLDFQDARSLMRVLIGSRAEREAGALDELVAQCARLPLALRVAAELAASRPDEPLWALTDELASAQRRLDLLDASGDPRTAVRGVFSWSYQHLEPAAAGMFRLLGLHPGPDFDGHAAAALTGVAPNRGSDLLGALARAHLIQPARPGRYGMHDLLRAYARGLAAVHDGKAGEAGADGQRSALTALFDYYLSTTAAAVDTLYPAWRRRSSTPVPPCAAASPDVGSSDRAREWLEVHLPVVTAMVGDAADHDWPAHATRLTELLFHYLYASGSYPEAIAIFGAARRAGRRSGDMAAEALALNYASIIDVQQGRYRQATENLNQALDLFRKVGNRPVDEAKALGNLGNIALRLGDSAAGTDCMRQALELFRQAGDSMGEGNVLGSLAGIDYQLGRYHQASGNLEQAIILYRDAGDQPGEARALINLGTVDLRLGRHRQAAEKFRRSLALFRQTGDRSSAAYALASLGAADLRDGRYRQAAGGLQQALDIFTSIRDRTGEAQTLIHLGALGLSEGRPGEAIAHLRRAVALSQEIGDKPGEAEALNGLGEVLTAAGRAAEALGRHASALVLAEHTGDSYEQARAHCGLAEARNVIGDLACARRDWQQARDRYAELGTPEAGQVQARLAESLG